MSASNSDTGLPLAEYLKTHYRTSSGGIAWVRLGGELIAGLFTGVWAGLVGIPQGVGAALDAVFEPVESALRSGGSTITAELSDIGAQWDAVNAGFLSAPVNGLIVLAVFAFIAAGWSRYA